LKNTGLNRFLVYQVIVINILRTIFLYKYDVLAAFPNYMNIEKAAETTFVQKMRPYNVDETDTWKKMM